LRAARRVLCIALMELTATQQAHLLERLILDRVRSTVDLDGLRELEAQLAIELARSGEITDDLMLATSRMLIARALARVGAFDDDPELRARYYNALGWEGVALRKSG
jgi:hypothetical protein